MTYQAYALVLEALINVELLPAQKQWIKHLLQQQDTPFQKHQFRDSFREHIVQS